MTSSGHSNYEGSKGGCEMIWCRRKIDKQVQVFQSDEQSLYHVQNMKWGVILIHSVIDVITKGLFASPVTSQ